MKYNLIYIASLFLSCLLLGCDDKTEDFNGPYSLIVTGPTEVVPSQSATYRLAPYENPSSYTWTIEGPGTIVGPTTGLVVKVAFSSVGSVKLTVTNGKDKALYPITVSDVSPDAEVKLNGTGVLKTASKDTVFLVYPAPLKATPTITMLTASDPSQFGDGDAFESGQLLGPLQKLPGDDVTYFAIYEAGDGNGTPEALVTGAESTDDFGDDKVDSLYIQLYQVDNIAPIADISYSTLLGKTGTEVDVTVTFSEPVTFKGPTDKAMRIKFSGAGVTVESDTLASTDNPRIYTYKYKITGTGDGMLDVALLNITDLGGNALVSTTSTGGQVTIDNTKPVVVGSATDSGDYASISVTSTEAGMATYAVLPSADPAPATANALINTDGAKSVAVAAGVPTSVSKLLDTGSYKIYFISQDAAGNYSDISSTSVTMD